MSLASFRRFWAGGGEEELVLCAAGPSQSQPVELQDALQVREQHLDLLPLAPRGLVGRGCGDVASEIARPFVDRARHLARGRLRAAPGLERTGVAVVLAGAIEQRRPVVHHRALGGEHLAAWAEV